MHLLAGVAALAPPAAARHGHDHVAETQSLPIQHTKSLATSGPEALISVEIENGSDRS